MPPDANEASCSVEVWLERDVADVSKTILAFYSPENPLQLTVHQYYALLILQCERENKPRRTEMIEIINARSLLSDVPFAVASGPQETSIYFDGSLARKFAWFRMANDCRAQLVIGTSPVTDNSWTGILRGLAVYEWALTAARVLEN